MNEESRNSLLSRLTARITQPPGTYCMPVMSTNSALVNGGAASLSGPSVQIANGCGQNQLVVAASANGGTACPVPIASGSGQIQPVVSTLTDGGAACLSVGTVQMANGSGQIQPVFAAPANSSPAWISMPMSSRTRHDSSICTTPCRSRSRSTDPKKSKFTPHREGFVKAVLVVKSKKVQRVPKTEDEMSFYRKNGLICDIAELSKNWSEEKLKTEFRNMFRDHLLDKDFQILQRYKKKLFEINTNGKPLDGERLARVFKNQGTIYLRPNSDLSPFETSSVSETSSDESDSDEGSHDRSYASHSRRQGSTARPIRIPVCSSCHASNINSSNPVQQESMLEVELSREAEPVSETEPIQEVVPQEVQPIQEVDLTREIEPVRNFEPDEIDRNENIVPLRTVLQRVQIRQLDEEELYVLVQRGDMLNSARLAFEHEVLFDRRLKVEILDDLNMVETGEDGGGLTRDFLTCSLDELRTTRIFAGNDYEKDLIYNESAESRREYYVAGVLIALAFVHGANGPTFFSKNLFNWISRGILNIEPSLDTIHEPNIRTDLIVLRCCRTLEQLSTHLSRSQIFAVCPSAVEPYNLEKKELIYAEAVEYYGRTVVLPAYNQLIEGLSILGVKDLITEYPRSFLPSFIAIKEKLTFDSFRRIFTIERSVRGHNNFNIETSVLFLWLTFLRDVGAGRVNLPELEDVVACSIRFYDSNVLMLEDILRAATGVTSLPPRGFEFSPKITFLHAKPSQPHLEASSCVGVIRLPVKVTSIDHYNTFKTNMVDGITNGLYLFGLH